MNKKMNTFKVMTTKFVDEDNNKIDKEFLNEQIILTISNDRRFCNLATNNNRMKIHSIVWSGLLSLADYYLDCKGYKGYTATSQHLKDWLKEYGNGYDTLSTSIEYFDQIRNEYMKANKQIKTKKNVCSDRVERRG